jgi:glycosyltransferase involved in cell wall biosynthesis
MSGSYHPAQARSGGCCARNNGEQMNSKPRVTVIMSFLNPGRFIEEAVDSVFLQSYRNWELLLIDDGSVDGSSDFARKCADRNVERVRYIEHPGHDNRGISASHNVGIREAKGEFIAILDADDVWLPEKLELQTAILDSQPEAIMLYGKTYYWYGWNTQPGDGNRDHLIDSRIEPESLIKPPSLLVKFLKEETPIPCPSDILVRRRGAIDVGGFEESFHHIFTDQGFYSKLCLKWPVFVSDTNWSKYRKHPDSAVARIKKAGQLRESRQAYLTWLESYLDKQGASDMQLRRALKIAKLKCRYPGLHRFRQHVRYRALIANELLRSAARQTLPGPVIRLLREQSLNRVHRSN